MAGPAMKGKTASKGKSTKGKDKPRDLKHPQGTQVRHPFSCLRCQQFLPPHSYKGLRTPYI